MEARDSVTGIGAVPRGAPVHSDSAKIATRNATKQATPSRRLTLATFLLHRLFAYSGLTITGRRPITLSTMLTASRRVRRGLNELQATGRSRDTSLVVEAH